MNSITNLLDEHDRAVNILEGIQFSFHRDITIEELKKISETIFLCDAGFYVDYLDNYYSEDTLTTIIQQDGNFVRAIINGNVDFEEVRFVENMYSGATQTLDGSDYYKIKEFLEAIEELEETEEI